MLCRTMPPRWLLGAALSVAVLTAASPFALAEEQAGDWVELLKSDKLDTNWHTKGNWTLEDGVATLTPSQGQSGWSRWDNYLWSNKPYGDFEIEFDYKVQKNGNSGFYFRVGDENDPVPKGIEVQIYDSGSKPEDARLTDHDSGGVIPGIPPQKNSAKPAGEWNTFNIVNKGDKLTVKLNGVVVNEIDLTKAPLNSRPKEGPIGFQDHSLPLSLRNIRIRPL